MNTRKNQKRGSVLVTAVIFGIALMTAVAGYVYLASQSMKVANRTFHLNSAMNLAEAGIEEGLHALNMFQGNSSATKDYTAWANWTTNIDGDGDGSAIDAKRTFSYFSSNQGTSGSFTVIVTNWDLINEKTNHPKIIVRATSTLNSGGTISKYVRGLTGRRSLFSDSMVARRDIRFNGNNAYVDSYDANLGPYEPDINTNGIKDSPDDTTGPAGIPDGIVNRFDNATVASASVGVTLGNADIWGAVATSGPAPNVGPNGTIGDIGSAQGTVDSTHVSTDFQANFPDLTPSTSGAAVYNSFPAPVDVGGVNTVYLGSSSSSAMQPTVYLISGNITMGTGSPTTRIDRIVVQGPTRVIHTGSLSGAGTTGIVINSIPQLFTTAAATELVDPNIPPLQYWVSGDFILTGQGLANPYTNALSVQIYGTAPVPSGSSGTQTINIKGLGTLSATVYAPNADLTIAGNGDVYGSFVANTITVSGNASFHYDESLANNGTGKFGITTWRELLTPAQRSGYSW